MERQGLHRLMSGVLQWYMEYSRKNDVDDHIRSGDLCQMRSIMGALEPNSPNSVPPSSRSIRLGLPKLELWLSLGPACQ